MRRTMITALVVLALAAGVCAACAVSVDRAVRGADALRQEAARLAELGNVDGAKDVMARLDAYWRERSRVLELIASHDALADMESAIADAALCLAGGDAHEFKRASAALGIALERIHITEAVRLSNLF